MEGEGNIGLFALAHFLQAPHDYPDLGCLGTDHIGVAGCLHHHHIVVVVIVGVNLQEAAAEEGIAG